MDNTSATWLAVMRFAIGIDVGEPRSGLNRWARARLRWRTPVGVIGRWNT